LKQDVGGKFGQIMADTRAQSQAILEMRSMFRQFMRKDDSGDDGNPSISHSALENQSSHGQEGVDATKALLNSRHKARRVVVGVGKKNAAGGERVAQALEIPVNVTATPEEVTLSSEFECSVHSCYKMSCGLEGALVENVDRINKNSTVVC